jgi:hypothetical protein
MSTKTVKKFWIEPRDLPVTVKEFSFGYTDEKGKERKYKVAIKDNDEFSFHQFIHALYVCKKNNLLPWTLPAIRKTKDKVTITNPNADGEQMEMVLRVAESFQQAAKEEDKFPWEV